MEDSWKLGIQRVHDQNLMDIWTHSALNLAPKELKRLNAFRHFFLQVVTIADHCNATGRFITSNIFKGSRHTDRRSSYKWPHQQKPSPVAWAFVRKTLGWTISTPTGRLRIPLGNWLSRPMHQHWTFDLDMTKHRLVEQTEGGLYRIYSQARSYSPNFPSKHQVALRSRAHHSCLLSPFLPELQQSWKSLVSLRQSLRR